MLGLSYGEVFLLIGATAALIGPKDLPKIARTAGRLAGRAIGYVQVARGQFDSVMQQSRASEVHRELQDAMAQLDAIRYEIRSISLMNPGPMTRKLMDNADTPTLAQGSESTADVDPNLEVAKRTKQFDNVNTNLADLHSKAVTYAMLSESTTVKSTAARSDLDLEKLHIATGLVTVLPVSAESARLLPKKNDNIEGSDIVLEAILEAEVAHNAKHFFAKAENHIPKE